MTRKTTTKKKQTMQNRKKNLPKNRKRRTVAIVVADGGDDDAAAAGVSVAMSDVASVLVAGDFVNIVVVGIVNVARAAVVVAADCGRYVAGNLLLNYYSADLNAGVWIDVYDALLSLSKRNVAAETRRRRRSWTTTRSWYYL